MIPDEAVEDAYDALDEDTQLYMDWGNMKAALEAAAPHILDREAIARIGREHWVEKWEDPRYPSAVRCMKDGCDWEGRFPGDIADHVADLITR